jgi:hypothetical protein
MDFFGNQNHFTVPKPWLHLAIPNTHHTNVVQYDTDSALIGIDTLSSYTCTSSMQDFLPGTYSPDQTESITGLVSTNKTRRALEPSVGSSETMTGHSMSSYFLMFGSSKAIPFASYPRNAEDLQDEYQKGTGKMTMAGEMVLFWDGRRYKQTIHHHPRSKCPLLPTEPGINAAHQFTQIWNNCLPRKSMKVDTKSQPPTLLQMLAAKPPTNPITFLHFHGPPVG